MRNVLLFLCATIFSSFCFSASVTENKEWAKVFSAKSVNGVFLLCKSNADSCTTNSVERSGLGFIPASTFKIPNSLIALETGIVKNERQVFKWDGKPRAMKQWEQDLTLRTAMQFSVVPVYQQFSRQIGAKRMQKYLNTFAYGNTNIGGGIDQFWLDGQLRISAQQQVRFLQSLYLNQLPVPILNQLIVKQALVTEAKPDYIVYSKTGFSGTGTPGNPGVAWWVGWIEKGTEVYFFAFNMDIDNADKLPLRKGIPTTIMANENILSP